MKLTFNGINSGLSNNGGSRTILLSSQILESLGHKCNIVAFKDNFTWFKHKPVINYIPNDTDVVINIAAVDYMYTRRCNVPIKVAWWRAHESWSNSEEYLKQCYLDKKIINIVNSEGLKQLLVACGANSKVIYQGIDFDYWKNKKLRPKNKIRIGALYTKQPRKRWKDFVTLAKILGNKNYEYVGIGNAKPKEDFLTEFKLNANIDELNDLYSSCHIWFAPTESEGLHNVPMEAALCGCLIVCSDNKLNGMVLDYAFKDTAIIYKFGNIKKAAQLIRSPNWSLVDNMKKLIVNRIGSREKNMKKFINYLETV